MLIKHLTLQCRKTAGSGNSSKNWPQLCREHEEEFPYVRKCQPGTFNVKVLEKYEIPMDEALKKMAKTRGGNSKWYEHGNHISPFVKVVKVAGTPLDAWIYRGGWPDDILELISPTKISRIAGIEGEFFLEIEHGDLETPLPDMPLMPPRDLPVSLRSS